MAKIVYAEYRVSSSWNLDNICSNIGITMNDVLEYSVKWDTLYLTYKDSNGNEVEVEYDPNIYSASENFDYKYPSEEYSLDE